MTKTLSKTSTKTSKSHISLEKSTKTKQGTVKPAATKTSQFALLAAPRYFPSVTKTTGFGRLASMPGMEALKELDVSDAKGFSMDFPGYPCAAYLMASSSLIGQIFCSGEIPTTPDGWMKAFNSAPGFNREMTPVMFCHSLMGGLLLLIDREMCINPTYAAALDEHFGSRIAANRSAAEQAGLEAKAAVITEKYKDALSPLPGSHQKAT